MRICVCGWYFDDELLQSLWRINKKHPVTIVAHRDHERLKNCDLPYEVVENRGLEWGAYNHYLKNIWPQEDNVLFMHDDIRLRPIMSADYEILPGEIVFDHLAKIEFDQAWIFSNRAEEVINFGTHGRMVFFSERMLRLIRQRGGFPYDQCNTGYTGEGTKPEGVRGANAGVYYVQQMLKKVMERRPEWTIWQVVYARSLDFGYRGRFNEAKEHYIKEHLGGYGLQEEHPHTIVRYEKKDYDAQSPQSH